MTAFLTLYFKASCRAHFSSRDRATSLLSRSSEFFLAYNFPFLARWCQSHCYQTG